jgi:hypothetical protein
MHNRGRRLRNIIAAGLVCGVLAVIGYKMAGCLPHDADAWFCSAPGLMVLVAPLLPLLLGPVSVFVLVLGGIAGLMYWRERSGS